MPRHAVFACCCLALLVRPLAMAQSVPARTPIKPNDQLERADSAPPARPSPAHPDETTATPKGALKLLAAALRDGDADRIRQVLYAANPSEVKMVTAMADMAKAMAALQRSAVKAFGKDGAKEVVGDTDATDTESKARIDSAEVKIQGDSATITLEDSEEAPVVLKRVDGRWRLPMSEMSKGADPAALDERLAGLAEQAKLVRDLAQEVAAGKYNSPAQAHEAWQSRAMQASMQRPGAKGQGPAQAGQKKIEDRR